MSPKINRPKKYYEKLAEQHKISAIRSPVNEKRIDRVSKEEARDINRALTDGLTVGIVAAIFDRDKRVIEKFKRRVQQEIVEKAYLETHHKQKIREIAKEVPSALTLPLRLDSFLDKYVLGKYFVGNSLIEVVETAKPALELQFKAHLYEALLSHLKTGGFADIANKIESWSENSGEILDEFSKLLEVVKKDVENQYNLTPNSGIMLTEDFIESMCLFVIFGSITDPSLCRLISSNIFGHGILIRGLRDRNLSKYEHIYTLLVEKYAISDQAKQILEQFNVLKKTKKIIEDQLNRFSEMERLPGWCDLCR